MAEQERIYQVYTDAATGLYDRRTMWSRLAEEVSRARRYRYPLGLILVTFDAWEGDIPAAQMLWLAETLKRATRSSDILARYSEDTLAILLPCTDEGGALQLAQRIRQLTAVMPSPSAGQEGLPAVCIGVTSAPSEYGGDKVALVEQVEWALRKARSQDPRERTVVVRTAAGPTPPKGAVP